MYRASNCGKLTAEQVREIIEWHFGKVAVLDDGKPVEWRDDWVCKVAIDFRGIANELNEMLGGNENRISERLRGVASDMRNIGASSMTPRELFAYWAHEVDKAADLADFLVSMNPDGLPVGLTISEDGSLLNWRGENYVRQSALGGWKLTAEQVEEIVDRNCEWYEGGEIDAQAIADELNVMLRNGTCHDKNGFDESIGFECTSCETTVDSYMQTTTSDKPEQFRYCPNCGKEVK